MGARTILAISQEAMDRDNTGPRPTSLFGNNSRDARILRQAAKDTMRDIMRASDWRGLSELTSTWILALQPGVYAYPLPPDFLRILPDTEHRNGWPLGLIGPATPEVWSAWLNSGASVPTSMSWRIRNNAIYFNPTPAAAELVAIEYISNYLVVADVQPGDYDGETPPNPTAGLVPRDGHMEGGVSALVYSATGAEFAYETAPGYDAAAWALELYDILKRINPMSQIAPLPQMRKPDFEANTDMPAFSDDYLLSVGMTWRYRNALGKEHAQQKGDYYAELSMKQGSDGGGARPFRIGVNNYEAGVLPIGDGKWLVS